MQPTATVLVYSDDANTREQVRLAAGRRPAPGRSRRSSSWSARRLPAVLRSWTRAASTSACWTARRRPRAAWASAGRSRTRSSDCPPVLLLIGRPQDAWLATWSRADAAVTLPVDPVEFAAALAASAAAKQASAPSGRARLSAAAGPSWLSLPRGGAAPGTAPSPSGDREPAPTLCGVSLPLGRLALGTGHQRAALCHLSQSRFQSPKPLPNGVHRVALAADDLDDVALAHGVEEPFGVGGAHAGAAVADVGVALGARPTRGRRGRTRRSR